jgi:hypothetical protein
VPRSDHVTNTSLPGVSRPISRRRTSAALFLGVLAASLCASSPAWAGGGNAITGEPTPFADIHSAGPLEDIYVGNDLSCQIKREGAYQVYSGIPGDCGTFASYGGVLYTPDFEDHTGEEFEEEEEMHGGELEESATPFNSKAHVTEAEVEAAPAGEHNEAFKPISQSAVEGSGTTQSPYVVTSVVEAGAKLRLTQTDSYVVGNDYYTVNVQVENLGATTLPVRLYRGQDCYLGGADQGYGLVNGATPACTSTANNEPAGFIEALVPAASPASDYLETGYFTNWKAIGSRQPLGDSCDCETLEDNGDSVSWSLNIAAGETQAIAVTHVFSESGELPAPPPSPSKPTVNKPPSVAGGERPQTGSALTAETGSYGEAESYEYRWQRCNTSEPASCTDIAGADTTSYTPGSGDVGFYLRFVVRALNQAGASEAASPLVGPVGATPPLVLAPVTTTTTAPAQCSSTRSEAIHWKATRAMHLKNVVVTINGVFYRRLRGSARATTVSLAGRGGATVLVKILGTSSSGEHYAATRTYRPCISGRGSRQLRRSRYLTH